MIESGKSLSYSKNYCSVLEKIARLHDIKQNEKHPLILNFFIWLVLSFVIVWVGMVAMVTQLCI